jgi:hypothetical protein
VFTESRSVADRARRLEEQLGVECLGRRWYVTLGAGGMAVRLSGGFRGPNAAKDVRAWIARTLALWWDTLA